MRRWQTQVGDSSNSTFLMMMSCLHGEPQLKSPAASFIQLLSPSGSGTRQGRSAASISTVIGRNLPPAAPAPPSGRNAHPHVHLLRLVSLSAATPGQSASQPPWPSLGYCSTHLNVLASSLRIGHIGLSILRITYVCSCSRSGILLSVLASIDLLSVVFASATTRSNAGRSTRLLSSFQ